MRIPALLLFSVLGVSVLPSSPATAADEWPQFRGPTGDGRSDARDLPMKWSETQNVKWKTAIHDRGHSSPVIWGDQIWLTTATKDGKRMFVLCLDRKTGKILHDRKLFDVAAPEEGHLLNSYASPTPVIEAGRVYVHFGTYGTACLDTQTGTTLWVRDDLHCRHFRGPGSSPLVCGELLILHYDGFDVQYLVALDKRTGKTVWKTDRSTDFGNDDGDFRKAFSTPIVIPWAGERHLISSGSRATMAYDLQTGKELWKVRHPGQYTPVPRPLFGQGLVFLCTGYGKPELWAIRPGGQGDVTASHVAWKLTKSVPAKPSAVLVDDLIFMVNDSGIATCIEAASGKQVWQERVGGQYSASILETQGRLYLWSQEGKTTILAADRRYKVLGENRLDDGFMATPAVSGKALYVRTGSHLYRIEQ